MKGNSLLRKLAAVVTAAVMALTAAMPAGVYAAGTDAAPAKADKSESVDMYSTYTEGKVLKDSYGYSEQWFTADPEQENIGLALLSMQLLAATIAEDPTSLGGIFLKKLGFADPKFRGNKDPDVFDCNYTYASKKQADGTLLIAVSIQSFSYDNADKIKGWPQNFIVNPANEEGEHYGMSTAANAVIPEILDLCKESKVRLWITGHSRGGAIAGMIAAKLPEKLEEKNIENKGIYAYTFEAPNIVQPKDDADRAKIESSCKYIHNYYCSDDLIPRIPPWGMTVYGVRHQIDTDKANAGMSDELKKLGSDQTVPADYNREDSVKRVESIVAALVRYAPDRASYSEDHTDTVTLRDGGEIEIKYNYQDVMPKFMAVAFSGVLDDFSASKLLPYMGDAAAVFEKYIRGYLAELGRLDGDPDPNMFYWEAAQDMNPFLKEKLNIDLGLKDRELYALLKIMAPVAIDPDAAAGYDPNSGKEMSILVVTKYMMPAFNMKTVVFSHHFDSVIARLHVLAPLPESGGGSVEPEKTDPKPKTPTKVVKPKLSKKSITVKKGKTKTVKIINKKKGVNNKYKNTKIAKVVSKKSATKIKIKGLKKGRTTLKIRVNGVWLKLKVKVVK